MFGYRLLRESDYDRLVEQLDLARAEVSSLQEQRVTLLREVAEATANARSKATAADHLEMGFNEAKMNLGVMTAKLTGVPQTVPQVGKGTPLQAEGIGAGVDIFEDVGDERAEELRQKGMLHDDQSLAFPSTEALVPQA